MDNDKVVKNEKENYVKIFVIGVGSSANTVLNKMIRQEIDGIDYIAVNSDLSSLNENLAPAKIRFDSDEKAEEDINPLIKEANMIFIVTSAKSDSDTKIASVIAKTARKKGIFTAALAAKENLPEKENSAETDKNTKENIQNLKNNVDTIFVIQKDNTGDINKSTEEALTQCIVCIKNIIRSTDSVMNLDFADIKFMMSDKGYGYIGIGTGEGDNKIYEALENAKCFSVSEKPIRDAKCILINFTVGENMKLGDITKALKSFRENLGSSISLFFGVIHDKTFNDKVTVTLIATEFVQKQPEEKEYLQPRLP